MWEKIDPCTCKQSQYVKIAIREPQSIADRATYGGGGAAQVFYIVKGNWERAIASLSGEEIIALRNNDKKLTEMASFALDMREGVSAACVKKFTHSMMEHIIDGGLIYNNMMIASDEDPWWLEGHLSDS